jgi:hypothetical protein
VQASGSADLIKVTFEAHHPLIDQAAINFQLAFARTAKKTNPTALSF